MVTKTVTSRQGLLPTPPIPEDLPCVELTENARQVLMRRYVRRGEEGEPVETPEEMFWRVAYHIATAEEAYREALRSTYSVGGADVMAAARDFYTLLSSKKFFPNSPTFTGAGTPLGQLAACFVLPISDDMGRDPAGIFQSLRDAALIQQTGGGNGFSFSRLRPKGTFVKSSAGQATGPVGFLRVYDHAFGEIAQGGTRRGANMGVLRVDHPDIEDFITCKTDENQITNFNISVGITDAFMRAVRDNAEWELRFPDVNSPEYRGLSGTLEQAEQAGVPIRVYRKVRARELFDKIVQQAHHNGEPGVLFLDAANRANPVPHLYPLEATNPCAEQWLGPYENCCLGSVNLTEHCAAEGSVDWDSLRLSVELSTRFLDDVVDANAYVPAVPQLKEAAQRARRIGLGIMGLADLMYHVGVRYGSEEGQEFGAQVMEFVRYHAMRTSIELAKERQAFPAITGSIYRRPMRSTYSVGDPDAMMVAAPQGTVEAATMTWTPPQPLAPYTRDWGRPALDWEEIIEGIRCHGIRNAAQTTVAPTGTIATVAGCEGYGCEPVFALAYVRHVNDQGKDLQLTYASPRFEAALAAAGMNDAARRKIFEGVMEHGTCQDIPEVPESIRHIFVVSADISAEEHVRMQAAMQAFVDNSLSKCVTGDTLVLTGKGLAPIASLSDMRLPDQFEAHDLRIVSPVGTERSDYFYYGGMRETRRVMLSYGYEIEGTPNHRVHVLKGNGSIGFVMLDELKFGDTVVLYTGQQVFGPAGQALSPYQGKWNTCAKKIHFPENMSTELAYVLGCITSEGSIYQNGVQICNGDRSLLERLGDLFQVLFGLEYHICQDPRRDSVFSLQVHSRPLRDWLLTALGMEAGARNKIIPDCILRASRAEVAAFLRGLFLDAFMTLDGRTFGITLASRRLIRQLQTLLLNFGVFASLHKSSEHAWNLSVSGQALEQLAAFVEFDEVWKNQRIRIRGEGRSKVLHNYGTLLPAEATIHLRRMQEESTCSLRSLYGQQTAEYQRARVNLLQGHRMERGLAQRVYQHFSDAALPYSQNFFTNDADGMMYVRVKRIEAGFNEVFDISVPGSHSFIANGLCNHNTINFPETATEEDVAKAYLLAWELGCKGITVYVTGSREKVVLETKATANRVGAAHKKQVVVENFRSPHGEALPMRSTYSVGLRRVPDGEAARSHPAGDAADRVGLDGRPSARRDVSADIIATQVAAWHEFKKPRPRALVGRTYRVETPLGKAFVTVNENGGGHPFEVFLNTAKAGSETAAVSEAIGRLISYILRLASPIAPRDRLAEVVKQLSGIGGGRSLGFGPHRVRSLPDGVGQVLNEYLRGETDPDVMEKKTSGNGHFGEETLDEVPQQIPLKMGDLCPECGEATMVNEEGCRKCYTCGYSEC